MEPQSKIIESLKLSLIHLEDKCCFPIFFDVQQAFHRVWHEGLLYKLKHNLRAPYYSVCYLQYRKFHVKVDGELSKILNMKRGVPQGSVLGPILYTIYTSNIPLVDNITLATYADDTAITAANGNHIEEN